MTGRRAPALLKYLGRGFVVHLAALMCAGAAYFTIKATLSPGKRAELQNQQVVTAKADPLQKNQLAPAPRPAEVLDGLYGFSVTVAVVLLAVIIGRYVFRLRL